MPFEYLTNTALEDVVRGLLAAVDERAKGLASELVPVPEALGRVTSEPVYARISAPHYHACAMDGVALAANVTFGASPTTPVEVPSERYVTVDTGDPLPEGCDAVVMVEDVVYPEGAGPQDLGSCPITLLAPSAPWSHVRQIGEDICAGEMLLTSGVQISPAALGALLAAGIQEVPVKVRPKVGIIPTGDEVVAPSDSPKPGDVMEFNSAIFSGMVRQWGGDPVVYPIVRDDPDAMRDMLACAVSECDAVLLNAGSSAGRDDYSARTVAVVGDVLYHGIAIKPGKPAIVGVADGAVVLGVPGYPVSGIIVVEALLKPVIERLLGCSLSRTARRSARACPARACRPLNTASSCACAWAMWTARWWRRRFRAVRAW